MGANNLTTEEDVDVNEFVKEGTTVNNAWGQPVEDQPKAIKFELGKDREEQEINHPSHYADDQFECIEVMMDTQGLDATQDFCILNAFKYLYRHRKKGGIKDLKKAKWYLEYAIDLEEKR